MNVDPNNPVSLDVVKEYIEENNFSDFAIDSTGFVEALKGWVIPGVDRIVTYKSDVTEGNVIIVAEENWSEQKHDKPFENARYKIVRAFKLGSNWSVSVDHQGLESEEIMHQLLQS